METNVFGYLVEQNQCETLEFLEYDMGKIGNFAIVKCLRTLYILTIYINYQLDALIIIYS
jgi:hypothetical protein